jgi:RNA polymerase primary sigma factor
MSPGEQPRPRRSTAHCVRRRTSQRSCRRERAAQRRLLLNARRGDEVARGELVAAHLGMVRSIAARYCDLGLPLDDLIQEGSIGLLEAIDRYDSSRSSDFEAFFRFHVRRAVRNALTEQARLIRLPKQVVERRRLLTTTEATLRATGERPTPSELATATGLSEREVLEARTAAIVPVSLDQVAVDDGSRLATLVADRSARDPEDATLSAERADLLRDAVSGLPLRTREIVTQHFGLGRPERDISAIAVDLHLSERRTRTIEHDGLSALSKALEPSGAPG